ncbi:MAG: tetratricopeptide repeat protein [Bacteriovoracia bacterium]
MTTRKLIAIFLTASSVVGINELRADSYRVNAEGNMLFLETPYGTRVFFGDYGFGDLRGYRLEIPIEDLRTKPGEASNTLAQGGGNGNGNQNPKSPSEIDDSDDLIVEANQLYYKGKFRDALKYIDEVLRRKPENVRALIMKGSLMHVLGQKDAAKKSWQKAVKLDPENKDLKTLVGSSQ